MNQQQTIIKVISFTEVPKNYTGIAIRSNGSKCWYKEGKTHREDGPAVEYYNGTKEWWIDGKEYDHILLLTLVENVIFLEKQKGKYNLYWLKFLTENQGIKEFPIVPGMEQYGKFKELLKKIGQTSP